jgi:hypothetical protein
MVPCLAALYAVLVLILIHSSAKEIRAIVAATCLHRKYVVLNLNYAFLFQRRRYHALLALFWL